MIPNLLKTWLMLCLLLVGVGTSWAEDATMVKGTNATNATVNEKDAIKVGTSKAGGDMTITVPAGATSLEFYAAAWSGVTGLSLNITPTANVSPTSVSLTADAGIANNSPFTLSGTESSYKFTIALSNITAETKIKLTSSTTKRFVVWGATYSSAADTRTAVNMTGFSATSATLIKGENTTTSITNDQNGWTPSYTYESSNTDVATVSNTGVITAVAKGTATITASLNIANDDATWKKGATASKSVDIVVNNPSHTAHFSINGTIDPAKDASVEEGASIIFPSDPTDINGKKFVGWAENTIDGTTNTAPTFVTSGTMGDGDVTYYAVFAKEDGEETTESFGWEEATTPSNWVVGGTITRTEGTSSNPANSGSYYGALNSNSSVQFKNKVKVKSFSYYCVRKTNNTNTSIKIETSTNGTSWTEALSTTWATFNNDGKTYKKIEKTWDEPVECYVRVNIVTAAGRMLDDVSITYGEVGYSNYCTTVGEPESELTLIGIEATGTPAEFWKGDAFNHNGITVTALWDDETETDVTSSCEFTGYDMSTPGQQTVTVSYQGETCQYDIEVKTIANTQAEAYTVAEAKAIIDAGKDLTTQVYVKGTVSEIVTAWSDQYNNITYNISDDGETTGQQFQLYRCITNGAEVGDDVVANGTLTKYNETYEFAAGNSIVKTEKLATLSIADITVANDEDINPVITTNVTGEYAIEYVSDNEEVVLADDDELVTMGAGTATITATLVADGYKTAETTFKVTVTAEGATLQSITLGGELTKTTYTIGDAFDRTGLTITANYSDDSHVDVTDQAEWAFDPETFTTAGANINVDVYATFGGKETEVESYTVTVNKKTASISFAPATIEVEVGKNITLEPTTTPADAEISYTITEGSENVSLENGVVTGVAEGTATISADYAGNDEYDAASTTVTINVIPADESITVTQTGFSSTSGNMVDDTNGEDANISYEAFQGNASTYPAVISNNLRLYQNGGYVTVKALTGLRIASVKITTGTTYASTTVGYCVDDEDAPTTGETVAKSSDYTISGLNNSSVSIYCLGTDKNTRLDIAAIEVKYSGTVVVELKNIELSGTYSTEFTQGDAFSHEGMTVTANYTNGNNADVTSSATFSGYDMNTLGAQTVTVSYTEDEITKTAQYQITVNKAPFVPTPVGEGYEVVNFTALYSSVTTNATVEDYEGTSFSMAFAKPQSSNTPTKYYDNGKAVRAYEGNTITITGAEPITNVDIAWVSGYVDEAVSFSGFGTKTVVVTFSKTCRFTSITVDYREQQLNLIATDGEGNYYATFSSTKNVKFVNAEVYTITVADNKLTLNGVKSKQVPARNGVLIKSTDTKVAYINVDNATTLGDNMLVPCTSTGIFKADADENYYYKLAYGNSDRTGLGFWWGANDGSGNFNVKAGGAVLVVPQNVGGSVKGFSFDMFGSDETAIKQVENTHAGEAIYNLQGMRMQKLQKGINIVNGKKVVVK